MKAVVLFSGGLDSTLALKIVQEWFIDTFPLYVYHRFLSLKHQPKLPDLKVIDATSEFIEIVKSPQHGYGKNLNPCIDCRIIMLKKAKEYMKKVKADFIVTGEVLDQRPMSQHMEQLMLLEKAADVEGLVVRPLSGKLLPPTIPEKEGQISRELMLEIKGRSRRATLNLAQQMKIMEYTSPSGGCLLTDPGFCRRLADLMRYRDKFEERDIDLLKIGRHFRLDSETKVIVGRNEEENKIIEELMTAKDIILLVSDTGSPNTLLIGNKKMLKTAASITARYSDKKNEPTVTVIYRQKKIEKKISCSPMTNDELARLRL